jgi:hypothetical protein
MAKLTKSRAHKPLVEDGGMSFGTSYDKWGFTIHSETHSYHLLLSDQEMMHAVAFLVNEKVGAPYYPKPKLSQSLRKLADMLEKENV